MLNGFQVCLWKEVPRIDVGIFVCRVQIWNLVKLLSTPSTAPAVFGGILLGYVMYDCTHYYLHHGQPKSEMPRNLKVKALPSLTADDN